MEFDVKETENVSKEAGKTIGESYDCPSRNEKC